MSDNPVDRHIVPGAKCCVCNLEQATTLTRLVVREREMPQDAMLWGGATCWNCALSFGGLLQAKIKGMKDL